MPTRKQKRRREKDRRHEYEYVYVDEEGQEVEVDPDELEQAAPRGARRIGKEARKAQSGRPARKVDPPSWNRVVRRALILVPAIFFALTVLSHKQPVGTRLFITAFYTAFFIPFMYLLDRTMYRTYLRRTGQAPAATSSRRR